MVKATLDELRILRLEQDQSVQQSGILSEVSSYNLWTYDTVILFAEEDLEEFVPFKLQLSVSRAEETDVSFFLTCNMIKSQPDEKTPVNYEIDVGEYSNLDETQMKKILVDSVIHRDLSSIHSIYSLRRFEVLITQIFLKRFSLKKTTNGKRQVKSLKLVLEPSNPFIFSSEVDIQGQKY